LPDKQHLPASEPDIAEWGTRHDSSNSLKHLSLHL